MPWSLEGILPCRRQLALEKDLDAFASLEEAPRIAVRVHEFMRDFAARDLSGGLLTRLIAAFNDRLTVRVIELTARRHRMPKGSWCWLALGSEGRHEQSLVSDQDNGLVFSATDRHEADALREIFLPFAQDVNRRLADCGFPLCNGGIMAGNPAWCLSLDEWRRRFYEWVRRPEPEALLNATIFFDLSARLPERFDFGGQVAFQLGELPDHFAFQFLNGGDHATITVRPRHWRHREPHRRYQHGEAFADTTRPDGATFAMHQRLPFVYIAFNRIINKY